MSIDPPCTVAVLALAAPVPLPRSSIPPASRLDRRWIVTGTCCWILCPAVSRRAPSRPGRSHGLAGCVTRRGGPLLRHAHQQRIGLPRLGHAADTVHRTRLGQCPCEEPCRKGSAPGGARPIGHRPPQRTIYIRWFVPAAGCRGGRSVGMIGDLLSRAELVSPRTAHLEIEWLTVVTGAHVPVIFYWLAACLCFVGEADAAFSALRSAARSADVGPV